jgi:hypothetical protein
MNETFDLRRLGSLLRADLIGEIRTLVIVASTLAALMLFGSMWRVARFETTGSYYGVWYVGILLVWGSIAASQSFRELHDKTRNEAYLLLPASALEKTLARLLRATVGFFVFLLIFMTATSAVIEGINRLVFGRHNAVFNPSLGVEWVPAGHFLVVVSVFFLGAAWFRRAHFVKTMLVLNALPIVLGLEAGLIARLLLGNDFTFIGSQMGDGDFYGYYLAHQGVFDALRGAFEVVYFAALPLFCWYVAWLRVRETQTSDGV